MESNNRAERIEKVKRALLEKRNTPVFNLAKAVNKATDGECSIEDIFFLIEHITSSGDDAMREHIAKAAKELVLLGKLTFSDAISDYKGVLNRHANEHVDTEDRQNKAEAERRQRDAAFRKACIEKGVEIINEFQNILDLLETRLTKFEPNHLQKLILYYLEKNFSVKVIKIKNWFTPAYFYWSNKDAALNVFHRLRNTRPEQRLLLIEEGYADTPFYNIHRNSPFMNFSS